MLLMRYLAGDLSLWFRVLRVPRFTAALDACRGANEMWVKLSNCNIFDVKAKKVRGAGRSLNGTAKSANAGFRHLTCTRASVAGAAGRRPEVELVHYLAGPVSKPHLG